MTDLNRPRASTLPAAAMGVLLLLLLGAVAARGQREAQRGQHDLDALTSELARTQQQSKAALDSTTEQIAMAQHMLSWLEQKHDASSAQLILEVGSLRQAHRAPAALSVVAELTGTGQLDVVPDVAIRARLIMLDRRLAHAATTAEPVFERYRARLDEVLSPGMWRYIFKGESGSYVIDYKATVQQLYEAGFDRTLRTLLRGLAEQRLELMALTAEAGALHGAMQSARGQPTQ